MENIERPTVLFGRSKWIWAPDAAKKNSHVIIRRAFSFPQDKKPPARAICHIACDTRYCLFVNGNAAVWLGGADRGKSAYYDEIDIAKYLVKGDNALVFFCRFFGNDGRDFTTSGRAGLIFECDELGIYSDGSFSVYENRAYGMPKQSNCSYAGWGVNYDASLEGQIQNVLDPSFNSSLFVAATELSDYPDGVMGVLLPRPLPLEKFSPQPVICKAKKISDQFSGDRYVISLPRRMRVTPYMQVAGNGQEKIEIFTDCTAVMGAFGDERSVYTGHTVEYTTKPTVNDFDCMLPMTGNKLIFTMPHTVKVLKLGYREVCYNASPTCDVSTGDKAMDAVFGKALNTLLCNMGSSITDNPERDRTMWLGDASIAARAIYLAYADSAALVKKTVTDIMDYADGGVLYSCVPGNIPVDIPAHGLIALGEYGLFAQYLDFTGDMDFFSAEYERLCSYLMLWDMTAQGVQLRDGTRRWYDNLYNCDDRVLENALYYSACAFLRNIGKKIGNTDFDEDFDDRCANIAEYLESTWDGLGYTSREDCYDDRANAFVALAGLVPDERKAAVCRLLSSVFCASPYLEWAVTEALCKLGRSDLARKRFDMRSYLAVKDEGTSLGEDYMGFGTDCQSCRASAIFEIVQFFGGIDVKDGARRITITPDFGGLRDFRARLVLATGEIDVRYRYSEARVEIFIENRTTATVELCISPERLGRAVESKTIVVNKGKNKFAV